MCVSPAPDLSLAGLKLANVNPATGLATDYLNAFNEPLMLLEMVGDDPGFLEELALWRPVDYVGHFERSAFSFKDTVIAAYHCADSSLRERFDEAAARLGEAVANAIDSVFDAARDGEGGGELAALFVQSLRADVTDLDAMIHGTGRTAAQDAIDALFD